MQHQLRGISNPTQLIIRIFNPKKYTYKIYASRICFRKALAGLRIRKSAPQLRRITKSVAAYQRGALRPQNQNVMKCL